MDQVSATYNLFKFLKRLRVIGHLEAHTEPAAEQSGDIFGDYVMCDMTGADYSIVKDWYDPSRGRIDQDELLEKLFGRIKEPKLRSTS